MEHTEELNSMMAEKFFRSFLLPLKPEIMLLIKECIAEVGVKDQVLNNEGVMELLTIGRSTLSKYRKQGMPHTKNGSKYTYMKAAVTEWINKDK